MGRNSAGGFNNHPDPFSFYWSLCTAVFFQLTAKFRGIKSRRMRRAGHVARMGERRDVYRVLMGKREGKRPLRRPRRKWEVNIMYDYPD